MSTGELNIMSQAMLKPQSGSLLDLCFREMKRRNAVHATLYLPYYMSSAVLHELNIKNQVAPFYYDESGPYNFRLHLLYLTPTGGGKTYWVKNIGRQSNALLRGAVPMAFKGSMTAAAFTGTVKFGSNNEPRVIHGIAYKCAQHLVMIEEFSATLKSMENQHGDGLEDHFLTALDSGWVFRDLAAGDITFQTHATIQAASQFTRVRTSSGMLRRFIVVMFRPTREDRARLRAARRRRRRLQYDTTAALQIRKYFMELREDIGRIEGIMFDEDAIDAFFDKLGHTNFLPHYDEDIYERFIIGLNLIMKRDIPEVPYITLTKEMEQYVINAVRWRHDAMMGAELSLAMSFINDWFQDPPPGFDKSDGLPLKVYRLNMINFGLSFEESSYILKKLIAYNVIRVVNQKIKVGSY